MHLSRKRGTKQGDCDNNQAQCIMQCTRATDSGRTISFKDELGYNVDVDGAMRRYAYSQQLKPKPKAKHCMNFGHARRMTDLCGALKAIRSGQYHQEEVETAMIE